MDKSIASVGIDVSGKELVVSVDGTLLGSFENLESGLLELSLKLPLGCQVHLEASGGHDRLARRFLGEWGFQVQLHNPQRVRSVARGLGYGAKNDRLDANALSKVGPLLKPKPAKSASQEELCDISRTIEGLQDDISAHRTKLATPGLHKACKLIHERIIKVLRAEITKLEKSFVQMLKASEFKARYELAKSVPGIGPVTARVLACELPANLGDYHPSQISSYAGLAPMDDESGKRKGPRHIRKGNVHLKAALYMPAMVVVRRQEWAKALYARLRAKGRHFQSAIVAVMRKLRVMAVAVMNRGTAFEAEPPPRILNLN